MTECNKVSKSRLSYFLIAGLGLLAGIVTRLSDFFPSNTLWSLGSIATLLGFWILTATLVIYFSGSNWNAAINTFLYLFSMDFSFYFLKYVLGPFIPKYSGEAFHWNLFLLYGAAAVLCGAAAYVLYFWNRPSRLNGALYALPVGLLAAETIGVGLFFLNHLTFLFQLVFDFLGFSVIASWFFRKSRNKPVFLLTAAVAAVISYFFLYHSSI